jgi:hypothetical protein
MADQTQQAQQNDELKMQTDYAQLGLDKLLIKIKQETGQINALNVDDMIEDGIISAQKLSRKVSNVFTANIQIYKNYPALILNSMVTGDTDFWLAVNSEGAGDDDDVFIIGKGATPGTTPLWGIDGLNTLYFLMNAETRAYWKMGTPASSRSLARIYNNYSSKYGLEFQIDTQNRFGFYRLDDGTASDELYFWFGGTPVLPRLSFWSADHLIFGNGRLYTGVPLAVNGYPASDAGSSVGLYVVSGAAMLPGGIVLGNNDAVGFGNFALPEVTGAFMVIGNWSTGDNWDLVLGNGNNKPALFSVGTDNHLGLGWNLVKTTSSTPITWTTSRELNTANNFFSADDVGKIAVCWRSAIPKYFKITSYVNQKKVGVDSTPSDPVINYTQLDIYQFSFEIPPDNKALFRREITGHKMDEPADPATDEFCLWMSDGVGYGEDGDVCIKANIGGIVKSKVLAKYVYPTTTTSSSTTSSSTTSTTTSTSTSSSSSSTSTTTAP